MAVLTKPQLQELIDANLLDNTTGEISPFDLREVVSSLNDSFFNLVTNQDAAGLSDYDSTISYKINQCSVVDGDIYQANSQTSLGSFIGAEWDLISAYSESTSGLAGFLLKNNAFELEDGKLVNIIADDTNINALESGVYKTQQVSAPIGLDQEYPVAGKSLVVVYNSSSLADSLQYLYPHSDLSKFYVRKLDGTNWVENNFTNLTVSTHKFEDVYTNAINTTYSGNTITANYSGIFSGDGNTASNLYSFVGGGLNNTASGQTSVVIGSAVSTASGDGSVVIGGSNCQASGLYSGVYNSQNSSTDYAHTILLGSNIVADIPNCTYTENLKVKNVIYGDGTGIKRPIIQLTVADSPYTATWGEDLEIDCTNTNFTLNLPTAVGNNGLTLNVTKIDATNKDILIVPLGAETILTNAGIDITAQYQSVEYKANGTNISLR